MKNLGGWPSSRLERMEFKKLCFRITRSDVARSVFGRQQQGANLLITMMCKKLMIGLFLNNSELNHFSQHLRLGHRFVNKTTQEIRAYACALSYLQLSQ